MTTPFFRRLRITPARLGEAAGTEAQVPRPKPTPGRPDLASTPPERKAALALRLPGMPARRNPTAAADVAPVSGAAPVPSPARPVASPTPTVRPETARMPAAVPPVTPPTRSPIRPVEPPPLRPLGDAVVRLPAAVQPRASSTAQPAVPQPASPPGRAGQPDVSAGLPVQPRSAAGSAAQPSPVPPGPRAARTVAEAFGPSARIGPAATPPPAGQATQTGTSSGQQPGRPAQQRMVIEGKLTVSGDGTANLEGYGSVPSP